MGGRARAPLPLLELDRQGRGPVVALRSSKDRRAVQIERQQVDPRGLHQRPGRELGDVAGEDAIKEQRKREREKAKAAAAKARTENEAIGDGLLKRSSKPLSKKDQLETIRLLAKATVKQDDSLAGLGMRLCFTTWKEIEVKELKSGAKREKVTYLEPREAKERLIESIDNAKSVDEILRIVTNAMVTATYSNQDELPQSKRIWRTVDPIKNVGREDMEVIDRLAKGVLPENIEKKRQESVDEGYEKRQTPHYV